MAKAQVELRAAGEQVDPPGSPGAPAHPPGAGLLTAQQWQIAPLVATGATNREVAARLQVSPRTVDHHLRNIFVRWQIRSRVELAHRLPQLIGGTAGPPDDQPAG